jgi:D-xylose transport system ATP-binding protein
MNAQAHTGERLKMQGISKEFPGVKALADVSFSVRGGEIHALCGENGAGKSTLMKILAGTYAHSTFSGEILVEGTVQRFKHIRDSEAARIAIVHQELSLIPEMTVGENIFIGREPARFGVVDWSLLYRRSKELLNAVGLKVNPRTKVRDLGVGQQQLVEIAKALSHDPRILVLDEPTSALASDEVEVLKRVLFDLKSRGVSCILITHKLNEVMEVADRVTVLRDGRTIWTKDKSGLSQSEIIAAMVGRELSDFYPKTQRRLGETVLQVRNLTVKSHQKSGRVILNDVSFHVKRGEILGIAGLMGSGRTELLMTLFGVNLGSVCGEVTVDGVPVHARLPRHAIRAGMALLSEDRKRFGLILEDAIFKNMSLASLDRMSSFGVIDTSQEASRSEAMMRKLRVKAYSRNQIVKKLSGGNQQKVVFSKWLLTEPKVLFLDEPTRGIDIGAKVEIYNLINELAGAGMAVVMVSSELPEVLGVSDRILVMSEGRLTGEWASSQATQEKIMTAATGLQ